MKVYFYSPVKTIVGTAEGNFPIGKNVIEKEICEKDIVRAYPFGGESCRFCLDYPEINKNAAITTFYDGLLFIPLVKPKITDEYKVLYEKTLNIYGAQYFVSVSVDKRVKLTVRGYRSQKEIICPFVPSETETTVLKNSIAVQMKGSVTKLVVLALPTLEVVADTTAKKVYLSDTLVTEKTFTGAYEYLYSTQYNLSPFSVVRKYLDKKGKKRDNRLIDGISFFEILNYGGEIDEFLCDELIEKKEAIKNFIPPWKYIIPPIKKEYPATFCLLGKKPCYAKLTFGDGKITDIDVNEYPE